MASHIRPSVLRRLGEPHGADAGPAPDGSDLLDGPGPAGAAGGGFVGLQDLVDRREEEPPARAEGVEPPAADDADQLARDEADQVEEDEPELTADLSPDDGWTAPGEPAGDVDADPVEAGADEGDLDPEEVDAPDPDPVDEPTFAAALADELPAPAGDAGADDQEPGSEPDLVEGAGEDWSTLGAGYTLVDHDAPTEAPDRDDPWAVPAGDAAADEPTRLDVPAVPAAAGGLAAALAAAETQPPPVDEPSPRRRGKALAITDHLDEGGRTNRWLWGLVAVLLLVTAIVGVVVFTQDDGTPKAQDPPPTTSTTTTTEAERATTTVPKVATVAAEPSTVALGKEAPTAKVTLRNPKATAVQFTLDPSDDAITLTPSSGTIPADGVRVVTVSLDRSGLPDGPFDGSVEVTGNGIEGAFPVTADVAAGPKILEPQIDSAKAWVDPVCGTMPVVSAEVTDPSGVDRVVLQWLPPTGDPVDVPMAGTGSTWKGTVPASATPGNGRWIIHAYDAKGHESNTISSDLPVEGCAAAPGTTVPPPPADPTVVDPNAPPTTAPGETIPPMSPSSTTTTTTTAPVGFGDA